MDISVTRNRDGSLLLSTIHGDKTHREEYYKFRYFDYSVKEAKTLFRKFVKEEMAKIIVERPAPHVLKTRKAT